MAWLQVRRDSSAAIGVCRRAGTRRARLLAVAQLWVQERAHAGDFEFVEWPGERNPADVLAKA
eukprot:12600551-Alexandrium_andersonii.AAC.1